MEKFIFVYITNPDKETAKRIAKILLQNKLIACANIYNIDSLYCWEEKIADEIEFVLIGKTVESKYDAIIEKVQKNHPYSIPCVIKIPLQEINEPYAKWLTNEINEEK
ncbi:MAG: divalent-cation tolerance protein CutA [Candidatus Thorarchaeota archaeon]